MDWLREYIPDKRDRRKQISTPRTPSSSEIEDLHDTIIAVGIFIRTGVVDALISEDLEEALLTSCVHAQNISIMPSGYDIVTAQDDNVQEADIDSRNLGNDEIYETASELFEKPRKRVIRYLETLTAWYDASVALTRHKPFSKPLVVYKFTVPHSNLSVSVDEITSFKNNYLDSLSKQDLSEDDQIGVQQFLDKIRITPNETKKATIHAEASLMALGCDLQRRSYNNEACNRDAIQQVFSAETVPIGASKKCCWCCAQLGAILEVKSTRGGPKYSLPGTHATIFPWVAPVGLSTDVLLNMRDKLQNIFDRTARYSDNIPSSNRSSLESVLSELHLHDDVAVSRRGGRLH
ncbi:hypothetical protein QCA50_000674 [Cerrena zonata]|uniref:Uncharacterized protein n=1 Tax=Cerrena zonata TaxID=2478898 RepID=A0AAW0GYC9_9APHY